MLNTAVIGTGFMGINHARVYNEISNLAAVCDLDVEKAKKIADLYGCSYYKDHKEMLKKESIDAVSVVVPTSLHADVSLDVIKQGVNLLVEKPLARNVEEATKITKAVRDGGVILMVGHIERFNPAVQALKKMIEENRLGKTFSLHAVRAGPFTPRVNDAGVLSILAIHDLDVFQYVTNRKITKVMCYALENIYSKFEDNVKITCKLGENILGSIEANWTSPKKVRKLSVIGTKAMVELDYITQDFIFVEQDVVKQISEYHDMLLFNIVGEERHILVNKIEPLKQELSHFLECVKNKKQPLISGDDGVDALRLVEACIRSYKDGEEIVVNRS